VTLSTSRLRTALSSPESLDNSFILNLLADQVLTLDWCSKCSVSAARQASRVAAHLMPLKGNTTMPLFKQLWGEEEGQDLTEYALLLVLLALAAVGSMSTVANAINGVFAKAATNLSST
jgi:pilus assembly protein Flp/PilA